VVGGSHWQASIVVALWRFSSSWETNTMCTVLLCAGSSSRSPQAYSIGELGSEQQMRSTVRRLWAHTKDLLVRPWHTLTRCLLADLSLNVSQ